MVSGTLIAARVSLPGREIEVERASSEEDMTDRPFRIKPAVNEENEHFWKGGADGELCFLRCKACRSYIHPPAPICGECLGREYAPEAVSGRARLVTFTVNHQPWIPGFDPPYVIAIVEIEEQPSVRLTTNIVNCEAEALQIGMPLEVLFEPLDEETYLPLFQPARES
jgi:uncharacterized OB-fold protein